MFKSELDAAVNMLIRRIPKKDQAKINKVLQFFTNIESANEDHHHIGDKIYQALLFDRQLKIDYLDIKKNKSLQQTVDPYLISCKMTSPCLIGYCHLHRRFCLFHFNQIKELTVLDTHSSKQKLFNPSCYLPYWMQVCAQTETSGRLIDISIHFDEYAARFIRQQRWPGTCKLVELQKGELILQLQTFCMSDVKKWVLSWGRHARVLEPAFLVKDIQQEILELCKRYERQDQFPSDVSFAPVCN